MPDFGAPVAQNVNVSPQQGIQTLSGILGIKQQEQQLQTQTATAQQAQQQNTELQRLAAFTKSASQDPAYRNEDGSLNVQRFQADAQAVAPTYGQAYIGQATSNANASIQNRQALLGLSNAQRATAGQIFGAIAANPNATPQDFQNGIDQARGLSQDPGWQKAVDRMLFSHPNTSGMTDAQASQSVRQFARGIAMLTGAPNTGESAPTVSDYTTPSGQIGQRQTSPQSPLGMGPVGPQTPQGLGPTQTPAYQAAVTSAAQRAGGYAGIDIQRAQQISSSIQPSQAAIGLTQQIDSLADQIHSGKFADEVSKAAANVGMQAETYARQLLKKDLGQVQARAITNAPTDEARGTILAGYPDATSDPQTIHTAMDFIRGSFRQNLQRGQQMLQYQRQHPDMTGLQQADDAFTSRMDPLMTEFQSLKEPQQRIEFYRRNFATAKEAQAFKSKLGAANGAGP